MYRHAQTAAAAQFSIFRGSLPSPASEESDPSESETETMAELDRKRRQLDAEIASFKAQKEKEFYEFEQELRRRRTKRKRPSSSRDTPSTVTAPSVLDLLANTKLTNGHVCSGDDRHGHAHKATPPSAKPTLGDITKIETTATTTALSASPHYSLSKNLSRSPPHEDLTPPRSSSSTPKPSQGRDHHDAFPGVFTPAYLPLLDSSSSRSRSDPTAPPTGPTATPLRKSSTSSSSLPSSPVSKPAFKRANTAPLLLPSALRMPSGSSQRKRKHVSFQMTDGSVVSPSSSFEQSSPEIPVREEKAEAEDEAMADAPWSWSKGDSPISPVSPRTEIGGMRLEGDGDEDDEGGGGGGGYFGAAAAATAVLTAYTHTHTHAHAHAHVSANGNGVPVESTNGTMRPMGLQFDEAEDGGSGVGFFELEEELGQQNDRRQRRRFLEDEENEEKDHNTDDDEKTPEDQAEDLDMDGSVEDLKREHARDIGKSDFKSSDFSAGSVPIDIVARSWVGSYGH